MATIQFVAMSVRKMAEGDLGGCEIRTRSENPRITREVRAPKRSLDEDFDIYNAKKQKLLAEIEADKRRTLAGIDSDKQRTLADMAVIITERLSQGNQLPATLQIVLQLRHTLTAQLASMAEASIRGGA